MDQLTKEHLAKRDELIDKLRAAEDKIRDEEKEVNLAMVELNERINEYNKVLKEAETFCAAIVEEIESFMGSKSDTWKGENFEPYERWYSEWSDVILDPIDSEKQVVVEDTPHANDLLNLPIVP